MSTNEMSRRSALATLAGAAGLFAVRCAPSNSESGPDAATGGGDGGTGSGGSGDTCAVTPEGEIGPYFADDSADGFNRSNILSNLDGSSTQDGVPLALTITVVDTEQSCAPYVGAQIDIWHCNAEGVYSDIESEGTASAQWLRGYQVTDAGGRVTFQTIIPGWYSGRTTHIHLRIRSSYSDASSTSDGTNTTQCFFDQGFVDTLYTTVAPYSTEGKNPTTNASDHVYSGEENGANLLALAGDNTAGYTASVTIYLPIAAATSTTGGGPGSDMGPPPDGGFGPPPVDAGSASAGSASDAG